MPGLKGQQYTARGGAEDPATGQAWTYVISVCGQVSIPAAAKDICESLSPTTTALRYIVVDGSPFDSRCESLGEAGVAAMKTAQGVELLYSSSVNSTDCQTGSSLQLSVVCDATASETAKPTVVSDVSKSIVSDPDALGACVFATRLQAPCTLAAGEDDGPRSHTLKVVLIVVGAVAGVALVAGIAVIVVKKKKNSDGRNFDGDASLLGANDFGESEGGFTTASQSQF